VGGSYRASFSASVLSCNMSVVSVATVSPKLADCVVWHACRVSSFLVIWVLVDDMLDLAKSFSDTILSVSYLNSPCVLTVWREMDGRRRVGEVQDMGKG
jgi:hypothetical protein